MTPLAQERGLQEKALNSINDEQPRFSADRLDKSVLAPHTVSDNKFMIVTDADSGKEIAQIPVGVEPDAAIYDIERKLVFASNCDGTLTVVKHENPDKYSVLQNLRTQREARTMALDTASHKLFLRYEEIKPGQKPWDPGTLPELTPGTFHMMVVAPQS